MLNVPESSVRLLELVTRGARQHACGVCIPEIHFVRVYVRLQNRNQSGLVFTN